MSRILISAVLWVLLNQSPFVLAEETRPIRFEWAFGAKVGDNDRLVSIERDTTLSTGDRIQFYVKADTATVVYLIYVDSNGNLLTLSGLDTPSSSYIPDRERWFTLDETTGTESFYLASSHGRHKALEKASDRVRHGRRRRSSRTERPGDSPCALTAPYPSSPGNKSREIDHK